jgi:hypothetical protein
MFEVEVCFAVSGLYPNEARHGVGLRKLWQDLPLLLPEVPLETASEMSSVRQVVINLSHDGSRKQLE